MFALIAFCAGVVLCAFLPVLPASLPMLAALAGCALLYWHWRRTWILCLLALCCGLGYAAERAQWRLGQQLDGVLARQSVQLTGVVRDLPKPGEYGVRLRLEVESVQTVGVRLPPLLELNDYAKQDWPAGSRWQLTARLRPPAGVANGVGFDAEAWYWSEGVMATGSVAKGRQALGAAGDVPAWIDRLRERVTRRLAAAVADPREAALVTALAVGAQQTLVREDWQRLSVTGLTHVVSVSGLHITLIAALVAWLARRVLRYVPQVRRPLLWSLCAASLAAGAYALLAGFSVPTQRTLWMVLTATAALALQRGWLAMQIWLLALTVVLLLDPFAALAPGFWLSFGLVGALILMLAGRREPLPKWQAAVWAQAVVSVASIVPLALFFGQLPLVSPLANALGTPLVSVVITPLSLLAALLPFEFLARLAGWSAGLFWWWVDVLATMPAWNVARPTWPVLLAALLGTLAVIMPWSLSGRCLGLCLLLPLLWYRPPPLADGELQVEMLDVGQGLSLLFRTRHHALLYDTGAGEAGRVVLPVLRARDVKALDVLMLSHHDSDHDAGAAGVVDALKVGRILAGQPSFYPQAQPCLAGQGWQWDGVFFEVLWPTDVAAGADNERSCVLRVIAHGRALVVSGDLSQPGEAQLVARYGAALSSHVLVAGHHGSRTATGEGWLATVAPQLVLISAGYQNRYRHPHPLVLERLAAAGVGVWRSDGHGALSLQFRREEIAVTARRLAVRYYWQRQPLAAP